jgi:ADP-ribose pyrophosphatase
MKIIEYQKLTHKKWLNMFDIVYEDKSGQEKTWQIVSRQATPKCISGEFSKPDAVLMIPFHTKEQKLVVIREYRVSLAAFQYEFPAGLIDEGETIETAARRELKEETGLTLTRIKQISPALFNTAGLADESVSLIYCDCEGTPTNVENQGTEAIDVCLVSPTEVSQILSDNTVKCDVKLWMELVHFAANNLFS